MIVSYAAKNNTVQIDIFYFTYFAINRRFAIENGTHYI